MKVPWACVVLAVISSCADDAPSDAPPVISSALDITTAEDTPKVLAVDASDPDGLAVTIAVSTAPMHGTATVSAKALTYSPTANYHGQDTLGITVSDGVRSTIAVVSVTVTPVNDPPNGVTDSYATQEDVPLAIQHTALLGNDTDPDGDALTITQVTAGTGGTVSSAAGTVSFTPTPNSSGAAAFSYTVSDGASTTMVDVAVAVGAVNDPPVAVDDLGMTPEDMPAVIVAATLTANDTDADGQTPMVVAVASATGGTVLLTSGVVTFSPALDFNGAAGFDYTASDGMATDVGHVTITVTPINDPPVAVNDAATTPLGTPLVIAAATLLANDTDPDPGATKTLTLVQNPLQGTVSLNAGTITFTPAAGFVGAASFEYVVSDGMVTDTGTVAVTVTPICGDSVIHPGEACDDGNTTAGDGCGTTCLQETGWTCIGVPSSCTPICNDGLVRGTEPCDDGDADNTDGCTTQCVVGVICDAAAFPGGDRFAVAASTGTCYVSFDDDQLVFAAAETACVGAGGHLATLTTAAEDSLVRGIQNATQAPYIGATDDGVDADLVFDWVTDESWGATAFASGQPDDGPAGDGECLVLAAGGGGWADTSCTVAGAATGRICEIERISCGDTIVQSTRGEQCDDGGAVPGDGCSPTCRTETLYISEYVEGTSNNKVIEVANPFATSFDLTANACALKLFSNGSAVATNTLALTGTLAAGDVFVACHTSVAAPIMPQCDAFNGGVMGFNGDDAITLECNSVVLDSIGQTGVDPGTEWGTNLTSTADNTLRRLCGITQGDTNPGDLYDPATSFGGFATDTFDDIGAATCAP